MSALFTLDFPKTDYPDIELSNDDRKRILEVVIYQFFRNAIDMMYPRTQKSLCYDGLCRCYDTRYMSLDVFSRRS